jgi:hypothetical protein
MLFYLGAYRIMMSLSLWSRLDKKIENVIGDKGVSDVRSLKRNSIKGLSYYIPQGHLLNLNPTKRRPKSLNTTMMYHKLYHAEDQMFVNLYSNSQVLVPTFPNA